ncbi:MAG: YqiA/YcfP family alpha/beta fold hydrolase [Anaerolineales bacterium]|nr:YqiA/YcfP family alpha/beta fold hydrolase [Anaerolineales bacterium]
MDQQTVVYLHGFASSPEGEKGKFFQKNIVDLNNVRYLAINFNPTPQDFRMLTITGMINRLRQFLLDHDVIRPLLIGSSLGGLVGLRYASSYQVERMLLLAPLLAYQSLSMDDYALSRWKESGVIEIDHYAFPGKIDLGYRFHLDGLDYQEMIQPAAQTRIIHGRKDERVSIEDSRFYAEKHPQRVRLIEVDSDHRLKDQHEFIWKQIKSFLLTRD